MTSGGRFALAVLTIGLLTTGCGRRPSADERAVCRHLQGMIDGLAAGDNERALRSTAELGTAVRATHNPKLNQEGTRFFLTISAPTDVRDMTPEQIEDLGRRAMETSSGSLDKMIDECDAVGAGVDRLDQVPAARGPSSPLSGG